MSHNRKYVAFSLLVASGAGVSHGQTPREQLNPVDTYLQIKQQEFASSDRAANANGLGPHVTADYNLLRDKGALGMRMSSVGQPTNAGGSNPG